MTFGAAPLGATPLGSTAGALVVNTSHAAASLGCVVSFGAPVALWDLFSEAASLGCVASFGGASGAGNVYRARSLGNIAIFGGASTPGGTDCAAESIGYVVRFGHPLAIKFKKRAAA